MPEEKALHSLHDIAAVEVSFVPKAANRRKFLILKSEEEPQVKDSQIQASPNTNPQTEGPTMPDATKKAAVDPVKEPVAPTEEEIVKGVIATLSGLPAEAVKKIASVAGFTKPIEPEKVKKAEILATIPDEHKEKFEALWKANEEQVKKADKLATELAAEKDLRVTKDFVTKAETEFAALPGKSEDLGPVLKVMKETLPEDTFNAMETILKAANESFLRSTEFKEIGTPGTEEGSVFGKLETTVKEMVEKSDTPLTKEAALTQHLLANPELYAEYRQGG